MTSHVARTLSIFLLAVGCGESGSGLPDEDTLGSLDASADGKADGKAGIADTTATPADSAPVVDSPVQPDVADSASPDIDISIGPATIGVGGTCTDDLGCGLGMFCLDEGEGWPAEGYCTLPGCTGDAECGLDSLCSPPIGDDQFRLCFRKCEAGATCAAAKQSCATRVAGFIDVGRPVCSPGKKTAIDGSACSTFADCRGQQACVRNPFSAPDGMCVTVGCTPGDNSTCAPGGDGICVPFMATGLCLDTCSALADCRAGAGWTCQDDPADAFPGVCAWPHEDPGASCAAAADCGPEPWECLTGASFPGGTCGARGCVAGNEQTCPLDTRCHDPNPDLPNDQYCIATCQIDADCRGGDGYKCSALTDGNGVKGCKLAN